MEFLSGGFFFQAVKLSSRYCHYRFRTLSAYQTHWTLQSKRRLYLSVCEYEWMNERMNEPREYRMGFRMWPNSLWRNETTTFKWQGGKVGSKPLLKMKEWSLYVKQKKAHWTVTKVPSRWPGLPITTQILKPNSQVHTQTEQSSHIHGGRWWVKLLTNEQGCRWTRKHTLPMDWSWRHQFESYLV